MIWIWQSRDSTNVALHRTQRLLVRLREEKAALLDRVLLLESAAGLSSSTPSCLSSSTIPTSALAREFPLLYPPGPPISLSDRPRTKPKLTTASDLSSAAYDAPLEPPLPAEGQAPPRERSRALKTLVAAEKLRDDVEARRRAAGYGPAENHFAAVAVLGLEGSRVANQVERLLRGEVVELGEPQSRASGSAAASSSSNKRRRESSSGGGGGRNKRAESIAAPTPLAVETTAISALPNPFAAYSAPPPSAPPQPQSAPASTAAPAPEVSMSDASPATSQVQPAPSSSTNYVAASSSVPAGTAFSPIQTPQLQDEPAHSSYFGSPAGSSFSYDDASTGAGAGVGGGDVKPVLPPINPDPNPAPPPSVGVPTRGAPRVPPPPPSTFASSVPQPQPQPRKHRKSDVPPEQRMIKPKKLKTHGITSGTYPIPFVPRTPTGEPVLPMPAGIMVLRKLGSSFLISLL